MKTSLRYFLLLFGLTSSLLVSASGPDDAANAMVVIYADLGQGRGGLGSGFLASNLGEVVTCYHVIQNAVALQVYVAKNLYTTVEVLAIDPEHDLARLRIKNVPAGNRYLQTLTADPSQFSGQPLETYGATWIVNHQHFDARTTSASYEKSGEFRGEDGRRLFSLRDVDLITLDMLIYNGLSGAPLIFKGKVVGVISGSIQQGGSLAWAIPVKYLAHMQEVNKLVVAVQSWPDLMLMSPRWRNLRREVNLGVPLALGLNRYGALLDEMEDILHKLRPELFDHIKQAIDKDISARGQNADISVSTAALIESALEADGLTFDGLAEALKRGDQVDNDLDTAVAALYASIDKYFSALPVTQKNAALRSSTISDLKRIENSLKQNKKRMEAIGAKLDAAQGDSLAEVSRTFGIAAEAFRVVDVSPSFPEARKFQDVIEKMLETVNEPSEFGPAK